MKGTMTPAKVLAIFKAKGTHIQLACEFVTSPTTVGSIKSGRSWSELTGKTRRPRKVVTPEVMAIIRETPGSLAEKAAAADVSERTVSRYLKGGFSEAVE